MASKPGSSATDLTNILLNLQQASKLAGVEKEISNLKATQNKISKSQDEIATLQKQLNDSQKKQLEIQQQTLIQQQIQTQIQQQNQLEQERQKELKASVFAIRNSLEDILKNQDNLVKLILIAQLKAELNNNKIDPNEFTDLQEKEYTKQVIDKILNEEVQLLNTINDEEKIELNTYNEEVSKLTSIYNQYSLLNPKQTIKPKNKKKKYIISIKQFFLLLIASAVFFTWLEDTIFAKLPIYLMLILIFSPLLRRIIGGIIKKYSASSSKSKKLQNEMNECIKSFNSFIDELVIKHPELKILFNR